MMPQGLLQQQPAPAPHRARVTGIPTPLRPAPPLRRAPDASASAAMVRAVMVFTFWFSSLRPAEERRGCGRVDRGECGAGAGTTLRRRRQQAAGACDALPRTRTHAAPPPSAHLCVAPTVLDNVHQALQVRQHRAAHQDGNLLHDLDARVPRLRRGRVR